jgi:hypothetical protein
VPAVLQAVVGVQVTQSALAQDAQRRTAGEVGTSYAALRAELQEAPAVHTDDTGWRVGGATAFLMVFRSALTTVNQIRPRHRHEEVREVIPSDYAGVLITDRGRSYDAQALAGVQQQKCLSHCSQPTPSPRPSRRRACGSQQATRVLVVASRAQADQDLGVLPMMSSAA